MEHDLLRQAKSVRDDASLNDQEKIKKLRELYEYARGEQRAASESSMVDDDGLNDAFRTIEMALADLGDDMQSDADEKGAATL
ncbi:hypothetical protein [Rhizobium sp. PAMB 3182]